MKKFTFLLLTLPLLTGILRAQTTLEVGAGKTYATITDAWNFAKSDAATEFIIKVDAGTYIEVGVLAGKAGMKVTITGAGAGQTIVKKSASTTFALTTTTENPGRMFQLTNATTDINIQLVMENMTFETMGFNNTNGGGVVNMSQTGQKLTIRNCNFRNIIARAGAVVQILAADTEVNKIGRAHV